MFAFICILWSFWTAESIGEWFSLWKVVAIKMTADAGGAPLLLAAVLIAGGAARSAAGETRVAQAGAKAADRGNGALAMRPARAGHRIRLQRWVPPWLR